MSHGHNGDGRIPGFPERLVVVRVEDAIEPKLTARDGASYESPPQTRERAMTLVRLLLGGPWGRELRGQAFKRAHAYVADVFGEPTNEPQPAKENQR